MARKKGSGYYVDLDGFLPEKTHLEYLGKGKFVTAWRKPGTDLVYLVGYDVTKECIALWGQDKENGHIPVLKCAGYCNNNTEAQVYETRYYAPLKAANKTAWAEYKALKELLKKADTTILNKNGGFSYSIRSFSYSIYGYDVCQELVNLAAIDSRVSPLTVSALQTMLDAATNAGASIMMEFAPRNLGVNKNGQLVLLDVFFDSNKV